MNRKISIIEDLEGKKTVVIHDVRFKGKRSIDWNEVEEYLKQFVGEFYRIEQSNDVIYIGADLPDEYAHSNYTQILKGANAKAKANAAQAVPELLEIANNKQYEANRKVKHNRDAKFGWYSYDSRFAIPIFDEKGELEKYNVFRV
ncbi:MAG: hypothetical protein KBS66_02830, partial [Eubacterium sp.]|nr:hypothetical protein [Candidatus Colimonas fimequi]